MKKVVVGLLCLAILVALGLSVASTLPQISTVSSPVVVASNGEHVGGVLFGIEPCSGDPGGGSRPGNIVGSGQWR